MSLVTATLVSVCNCFLNWKHTNSESEVGDGRIYCLLLLTWRPWAIGFLPKTCIVCGSLATAAWPSPTALWCRSLYRCRELLWSSWRALCWSLLNFRGILPVLQPASGSLNGSPALCTWTEPPPPPHHTTGCCRHSLVASRSLGGCTPTCTRTRSGWLPKSIFP